jgi:hypothetical protein
MPCAANIAQDSEGFHVKPEHGSECRVPSAENLAPGTSNLEPES